MSDARHARPLVVVLLGGVLLLWAALPAGSGPVGRVLIGRAGVVGAADTRSRPVSSAPPARLDLPALGVRAAVVAVTVAADGELGVPTDPRLVGWWGTGGPLGATGSVTVLDGHVDNVSTGPGALFRLSALVPGDVVRVTTADGVVQIWKVVTLRSYAKAVLPAGIFVGSASPRLVIVTCGGRFDHDTHQYDDNIVVTAESA